MKAQIKTTWNRSVAQRSIEPLGEAVIAVFFIVNKAQLLTNQNQGFELTVL